MQNDYVEDDDGHEVNPLRFEEEEEATAPGSDGHNHGTAGGYVDEEEVS